MSLLRDRNLHIIFGISLTAVLGVSSIAPAFPAITRAVGITPKKVGLLISLFTVPGVVLTPLMGILADRLDERFALSPASIGVLMSVPAVIWGCGMGLNIPNLQTLLASLAPLEQQGAFLSLNGMVLRLGQQRFQAGGEHGLIRCRRLFGRPRTPTPPPNP